MRRLGALASILLALIGTVVLVVGLLPAHEDGVPRRPEIAPPAALPVAAPVVTGEGRNAPAASLADLGKPLAAIRIPALGSDWAYTVREGVRPADLDKGVGHYPGTALFGETGNAALAGHRWAGPFYEIERLHVGDLIHVEQQGARWTYEVTAEPRIIDATDVWVIDPTPGRMLTITTCWPKNGSSRREYVRARLIEETATP